MNKDFEEIVMAIYAELCVKWRIAHVGQLAQAGDFNFKLTSLEGVIKAFDLATPGQAQGGSQGSLSSEDEPRRRGDKSTAEEAGAGAILQD